MAADIIIITGPTGGHFFPGLALYEDIIECTNYNVKFIISRKNTILKWLKKENISFGILPVAKFSQKKFFLFPVQFTYAFFYSLIVLLREKPEIVVGTGSYVCVPFILASKILKKKIIIHEQNFIPGKATKMLSFISDKIALTFPNKKNLPKRKCFITGFPVIKEFKREFSREEIVNNEFNLDDRKTTILVMGGSQGAHFINSLIKENLPYFEGKNFQFIHLAGKDDKKNVEKVYRKSEIKAKVFDFFYNMGKVYTVTDVAICRAGAGTIAELCEWKIPAILIPYPFAGAHQKKNAGYLKERGGCELLKQSVESRKDFPVLFEDFFKRTHQIKKNLEKISIADSKRMFMKLVLTTIQNEDKYI